MKVIIPARAGSKGIPRKNMMKVGGKTLVQLSIEHALQLTDEVYVNSEDDEILEHAKEFGAIPYKRPMELAKDDTSLRDVISEMVGKGRGVFGLMANIDDLLILLPTYPLRNVQQTGDFWKRYLRAKKLRGVPSALCCRPCDPPDLCVRLEDYCKSTPATDRLIYRRQERELCVKLSHYLVACDSKELYTLDDGFYAENTFLYPLTEKPIDVDSEEDLQTARRESSFRHWKI